MSERSINKNSKTGHKFISQCEDKYGNITYRVQINRKDLKVKKRFKSLDEAIKYKDEITKC